MRRVGAWTARAVTLLNRLRGRLPYPQRCRELIALSYGQVLATGPTGDVLENPKVREAFLGLAV